MNIFTFIDSETTGLHTEEKSEVIEIGWATYRVGDGILNMGSNLIHPLRGIPQALTDIHGITEGMTAYVHQRQSFKTWAIESEAIKSSAFIAAFAEFDRTMLQKMYRERDLGNFPSIPWVDFLADIEFKPTVKGRSVSHIAADHGIVNNFAHRALTDILTMIAVIERGGYDLAAALHAATEPKVKIISLAGFDEKDVVKSHGFKWNGDAKQWYRTMRKSKAGAEIAKLPFQTKIVEL